MPEYFSLEMLTCIPKYQQHEETFGNGRQVRQLQSPGMGRMVPDKSYLSYVDMSSLRYSLCWGKGHYHQANVY